MKLSELLCVIFIVGTTCGLNGQDYTLKMSSPTEVGDRYIQKGSGSSSESMTIYSDGKVVKENKLEFKANLEGAVTVLKIDELKRASELKLIINKCFANYGEDPKKIEILQKDSEIIIKTLNKKTIFLFHDKPLPPRLAKVLDLFISLPHSTSTDDDIFAPAERKKVGDRWKINSKQAAKDLETTGIKIKPEAITGDVTLEKVVTVGKTKCLLIKADMKMNGVTPPLPSGLNTKKAIMNAVLSGEFPVKTNTKTYDPLTSNKKFSMDFEAEGQPAPDKPLIKIIIKMNKSIKKTTKNLQ